MYVYVCIHRYFQRGYSRYRGATSSTNSTWSVPLKLHFVFASAQDGPSVDDVVKAPERQEVIHQLKSTLVHKADIWIYHGYNTQWIQYLQ